jgi:hypothetical protein
MAAAFGMVLAYGAVLLGVLLLGGLAAAFVWALAVPVVFVLRMLIYRLLMLLVAGAGTNS